MPDGSVRIETYSVAPVKGDYLCIEDVFYEVQHRILWSGANGVQLSLVHLPLSCPSFGKK